MTVWGYEEFCMQRAGCIDDRLCQTKGFNLDLRKFSTVGFSTPGDSLAGWLQCVVFA